MSWRFARKKLVCFNEIARRQSRFECLFHAFDRPSVKKVKIFFPNFLFSARSLYLDLVSVKAGDDRRLGFMDDNGKFVQFHRITVSF